MNDFQGLLAGEYGFKTQGKSAPMAPPRSNPSAASSAFDFSIGGPNTAKAAPYSRTSVSKGFVHGDDVFRRSNSERNRKPEGSGNVGGLDGVVRGGFKPVYDDEVFDGVSGLKSSNSAKYEDIFTSFASSSNRNGAFDGLLGDLGRKKPESKSFGGVGREHEKNSPAFDGLFPGFGPNGTSSDRPDRGRAEKPTGDETRKGRSSNPMEQCSSLNSPGTKKPAGCGSACGVHDGMDPLDCLWESVHVNDKEDVTVKAKPKDRPSFIRSTEQCPEKKMPGEDFEQYSRYDTSSLCKNGRSETTSYRYTSSSNEGNGNSSGDVWLTVSEIPLLTQPTAAPPPLRPPPPRPPRISKAGAGSAALANAKVKVDDQSSFPSSAHHFQSRKSVPVGVKQNYASPINELDDFATGRNWNMSDENSDVLPGEDMKTNTDAAASAAAMKEAVDRAEAKFKHAKEVRERENVKAARMQQEKQEGTTADLHEREFRERMERKQQERLLREEEEERIKGKEEERLHREREEGEKEQRIIERERIERARARQAVERATREARGRAAAEAHSRAEKAAVGKVQAEARERAGKAAVLRAQAEARAAAGAKQRADRENAERAAREKAEREAKEKEARDMAAAAPTKAYQQKNENDLESFFNTGPRSSSNPRPSASSSDPFFDCQSNRQAGSARSSVGSAANMRKASLPTSFFDDLNSILGGSSTPWEFREVEGETEERRKARLARQQRTQERADKAVAEKNRRDLDAQREQAERHRISETLDVEIKRWAAGKEGNLRALLSTLQYVLWPECGWQPVSLTDLIAAAAVKKAYRKATLCIHPDKVQQKGATLQQKYIAEKVFDILKESWNKFNSEELF